MNTQAGTASGFTRYEPPVMSSTAACAWYSARWASIAPPVQSPMAQTPSAEVLMASSMAIAPLSTRTGPPSRPKPSSTGVMLDASSSLSHLSSNGSSFAVPRIISPSPSKAASDRRT